MRMRRNLLEGIAALDEKIEETGVAHPEFFIFDSLQEPERSWLRGCWRHWAAARAL
jgi:hypothetical protein